MILNLEMFFGARVLFPAGRGLDMFALVLALASLAAIVRFRLPIHYLVAAGALVGMAWRLLTR